MNKNQQIELSDLVKESLKIFEVEKISQLSGKLKEICINNKNEYYKNFKKLVKDLSIDWLQKIFQYYESNREELKQDYTPQCLGQLISKISDISENECIDLCSGSGALTIQKWNYNKNTKFICKEYDEKVIPYLLFNLAIRNIEATVQRIDVLQDEIYEEYKLIKQEEFCKVEVIK